MRLFALERAVAVTPWPIIGVLLRLKTFQNAFMCNQLEEVCYHTEVPCFKDTGWGSGLSNHNTDAFQTMW